MLSKTKTSLLANPTLRNPDRSASGVSGMMPDRQWYANSDSSIVVNGFNGMRKDNEINGVGNSLDFGARIYDARLGRWLSTDPLTKQFPSESPFQFAGSSPLWYVDLGGKSKYKVTRHVNEVTGEITIVKVLVETETLKKVSGSVSEDANVTPGWYWYDVHEVTQITYKANGMVITEELDDELGDKRTETSSYMTSRTYANWKKTETKEENRLDELNSNSLGHFGIVWTSTKQTKGSEEKRRIDGGEIRLEDADILLGALSIGSSKPGINIPKKFLTQPALESLYYIAKTVDVQGELISSGITIAEWVQEQLKDNKVTPTVVLESKSNTSVTLEPGKSIRRSYMSDGSVETDTVDGP